METEIKENDNRKRNRGHKLPDFLVRLKKAFAAFRQMDLRRRILIIVAALCILLALILFLVYFCGQMANKSKTDAYTKLKDNVVTEEAATDDTDVAYDVDIYEATGQQVAARTIDWAALEQENEDIYAWITIPNTNVDYPVLQDPDDDTYYLEHNIDGSTGYPGCIYSESTWNGTGFTDPATVLYGHNMKNKSMFATLHSFDDADFFAANRYIYVYLPNGHTLVYEIWTATTHSDEHILYTYDFSSGSGLTDFVDSVVAEAASGGFCDETAVSRIDGNSHILILSTCIANQSDKRWLVMGNLLNPEDL